MGSMILYALKKRKNSVLNEKHLLFSKNFDFSPFKDVINNEYKKIKLNDIKKRKDKKYLSQRIINNNSSVKYGNSDSNIINKNNDYDKNNIFNKTYFNDKGRNDKNFIKKKLFKRNISWNSPYNSINEIKKIKLNNNNQQENLIFSSFSNNNNNNNDLQFSNWTTRNKRKINLNNNNINNICNSDSNTYNNFYISNYSEMKNDTTNFFRKNSTPNKNKLFTKKSFVNSNKDMININSPKIIFIDNSSLNIRNNKNENKYKFNSEGNNFTKKYILKNIRKHSNSPIFNKIKSNIINKKEIDVNNLSKQFKLNFNRKVKSLKNITKACNTELIRIIDLNNKEDANNIRIKKKNNIDKVKKELDIRKDILDKNSNDKTNKGKIQKYKVLMNDVKVEMNLSNIEDKNIMNLIKKKINIISDSIALNMIEKCLGIKENVGFDIDELLNEHINKKKDIQKYKMQEIRKRAENNYQKMIKLRHNLSESKIYKSTLINDLEHKD
jgi:hypothetical protein